MRDFTPEQFRSEIPHPQTSSASAREVPAPPSARDVQVGPAQGPAATSAALPCGRGCRGRGISRRNSSAGSIRGASAREVPAPPSARDVQAGSAQDPAATSAALPCRRGCKGRGFHVGTVPPGRYAARRRAKYPRRPRRGMSKQARRRARPRQARPSRVTEDVGDARFHLGTILLGRYVAVRRAKYPRRPRRGTSKQGLVQGPAATSAALPCGRGCRGRAISHRNSSEVKSRITKPTTGAWPNYAAHKEREKVGGWGDWNLW